MFISPIEALPFICNCRLCMHVCVCARVCECARVLVCVIILRSILHLNNLFCRNLTLSTRHAYQGRRAAGKEGQRDASGITGHIITVENGWQSRQNGTETVVALFTVTGWRTLQHVRQRRTFIPCSNIIVFTQAIYLPCCNIITITICGTNTRT